MRLYRTREGIVAERDGAFYKLPDSDWDELLNRPNLASTLEQTISTLQPAPELAAVVEETALAPVGQQEVWAAGVTYYRSRTARMEESKDAGGGTFYDRVYVAERPEIFFKSAGWRVIGNRGPIRVRADSRWNVPEPELAVVANARGEIIGYTIGNDVSSRDIEGENPLYLPQAKIYDGSCALGPAILVASEPLPPETQIQLEIRRNGEVVFKGETTLSQMKRTPAELVSYLYRETSFPHGAILLTGTGVVPDDSFSLQSRDEVTITIPPIGTLTNYVA